MEAAFRAAVFKACKDYSKAKKAAEKADKRPRDDDDDDDAPPEPHHAPEPQEEPPAKKKTKGAPLTGDCQGRHWLDETECPGTRNDKHSEKDDAIRKRVRSFLPKGETRIICGACDRDLNKFKRAQKKETEKETPPY